MANVWSDETPEETERRLAMSACMKADVIFRGVRDGLCYFEVYFEDETEGPRAVLALFADGITAEQISQRAAEAERSGLWST